MDVGREIVSKVADEIIKFLKESVKRHFGYLICYKKKIQELDSEIKKLRDEKARIQGRVDRAKDDGEIIEDDVSNWLTKVQNMEDEVEEFLEDKVKENKECFKCWCPNLTWRHRLGKGAEEKKASIIILKDEGCKFDKLPVSHPASYPEVLQFTFSGDYMNFKSRDSVFDKIMGALKDSEVNLIGVHGPGGAGKTTMVEEAAKRAKKNGLFDETVMAVVSKDANVRKIQEELAAKLNLTYKEDNEVGRRGQLWNRLKGGNKKILVIMDDVWEQLDMEGIGIPIGDRNGGCKVLLTSRSNGVCQKMEVQKDFPIGVLEEQEAWSLFKKVVGNVPTEVTQSKAEEVCKECGGLPVAIVAVGAALKGKQGHVWDDALNQLKNSSVQEIPDIDPKMYTSLKWSYDYLEREDAKSCFLLCCLFPEDANIPIEDLVRYCMALRLLRHAETLEKARSRVQAMVDLLKSSCLLLNGKDENFVKMHDVIRDVAISITNGKQEGQQWPNKQQCLVKHGAKKWPEEVKWELYTAVSIMADKMDELPGDLQCPDLHTLLLQGRGFEQQNVPDLFFNGMKKLTVLHLAGVILSLASAFTNLVNLRMLQISDCHLRDIAMIKNLKNNLEILILKDKNIKELAPEIGELTRLRLLDLEKCYYLKVIPQGVISKLIRLEELYISQLFDQWEASTTSNKEKSNVSLAELMSLKELTTLHIHVPDVTLLPNDFHFDNLIRFQISVGGTLDFGKRDLSRELKLVGFRLKAMFNVLINRAEVLCLHKVEGLETLFHETHDRTVSNLKYLKVTDCHDLKYLCSPLCAKGLQQLQNLYISDCENMEGIVETEKERDEEGPENMMIDFSQLRNMQLVKLPNLISFYPEADKTIKENSYTVKQSLFNKKVVFPALEELQIEALQNTDIWDKQLVPISEKMAKSFCQLKDLMVKGCNKTVNVIPSNMIRQLQNLQHLSIYDCDSVISLVEESNTDEISEISTVSGELPCLRNVELVRLPNLINTGLEEKEYCSHRIPVGPNLTTLKILECDSLRNVFSSSGPRILGHLEDLYIRQCLNMEVILSDEGKEAEEDYVVEFPHLSYLKLEELPNLKSFKTSKFEAKSLFNHQVVFPALEVLHIKALPNTNIWGKPLLPISEKIAKSFCQLEDLIVKRCNKAVNVIPSNMIRQLQNLQYLSICDCDSVISLVEEPNADEISEIPTVSGELPCLRNVKLVRLPNLINTGLGDKEYCSHRIPIGPNLTTLKIRECDSMRNVFSSSGPRILDHLENLYIRQCLNMEAILSDEGKEAEADCIIEFSQLSNLKLEGLPNLKSFGTFKFEGQFLFSHQVAFPKLKNISATGLREIHLGPVMTGVQGSLEEVRLKGFDHMTLVSSPHLMQKFISLHKLVLTDCRLRVTQPFDLDGANGEEGQVEPRIEVELLILNCLSASACFWEKDPLVALALRNLKFLAVCDCSLLRNLFTNSVASSLNQLLALVVISCELMEEVVTNKGEDEAIDGVNIQFHKLTFLLLGNLPNLESFCRANYNFNFPSLKLVEVIGCPKMRTFNSGQARLSPMGIICKTEENEHFWIRDLNKYLEGEEIAFVRAPMVLIRDILDDFKEFMDGLEYIDCEDTIEEDTDDEDTEN